MYLNTTKQGKYALEKSKARSKASAQQNLRLAGDIISDF